MSEAAAATSAAPKFSGLQTQTIRKGHSQKVSYVALVLIKGLGTRCLLWPIANVAAMPKGTKE